MKKHSVLMAGILSFMLVFGLVLTGCPNLNNNDDDDPTVTGIIVSGDASVARGKQAAYTANVAGTNSPPQGVIWDIATPGVAAGTVIDANTGVLAVAANETLTSIIVRATSTFSEGIRGTKTVAIEVGTLNGSVSITGFAKVGVELTADITSLGGTGDPIYQWEISNSAGGPYANIPNATTVNYTPVADDVGKSLRVTVTLGTSWATSVPTPAVASVDTIPPTVDNVVVSGNDSVTRGGTGNYTATVTGSPATLPQTVSWSIVESNKNAGTFIDGDGKLTVAAGETLTSITVKAVSTINTGKSGDKNVTITNPSLTGSVSITGFAKEDTELTANTANLGGTGAISYQWQISASAGGPYDSIDGATTANYTPVAGDIGKFLKVTVTRAGYTGSVTSPATAAVADASAALPTVVSVTVSGNDSVAQGGTANYTATVTGTNSPPQAVTWSVEGTGKKAGTAISATGVLTVADDETLASITVKAVSNLDPSKSGTKAVSIITPTVTGVTVSGNDSVAKGKTGTYTATVAGTNDPPQTVTWDIATSGVKTGTSINSATGVLTVADDETLTSITVRATSTFDLGKSGTKSVSIPASTGGDDLVEIFNVIPQSMGATGAISVEEMIGYYTGGVFDLAGFRDAGGKLYLGNSEVTSGSTKIQPTDTVRLSVPESFLDKYYEEVFNGTPQSIGVSVAVSADNLIKGYSKEVYGEELDFAEFIMSGGVMFVNGKVVTSGNTMIQPKDTVRVLLADFYAYEEEEEGGLTPPPKEDLVPVFNGTPEEEMGVTVPMSANDMIKWYSKERFGYEADFEMFTQIDGEMYVNDKKVVDGSTMIQPSDMVRVLLPAGLLDGGSGPSGGEQGTGSDGNRPSGGENEESGIGISPIAANRLRAASPWSTFRRAVLQQRFRKVWGK
jgi:hypothetical protein